VLASLARRANNLLLLCSFRSLRVPTTFYSRARFARTFFHARPAHSSQLDSSLAAGSVSHDEEGGGNFPGLISLAKGSGINVGVLDPSLSASLTHLAGKQWALLPFAYAAAFALGDTWRTTKCVP
jgi:hypothetical protein